HGMICLDERGEVVRPALLWHDVRSAEAAAELVAELGGPAAWARTVGSVPVASFTVTKLRWFARAEPKLADRTASVLLPHDWLTELLRDGGDGLPTTDRGDASGVLTAAASLLAVPLSTVDDLALSAEPGAGGLTLLPYLDGERTPNLPAARGLLAGLTRANATPANLARAAVEGMLCGLADGLDALRGQNVAVDRILLVGGGAGSAAVRALAPALFGVEVAVPAPAEYVALGAARQAAWA